MSGIVSPGYLSPMTGFTVGGLPRVYYQTRDNDLMQLEWTGSIWAPSALISQTGAPPPLKAGFLAGFNGVDGYPAIYYLSSNKHVMELGFGGSGWTVSDVTALVPDYSTLFGKDGTDGPLIAFNVPPTSPHVYSLSEGYAPTLTQDVGIHVMELEWTGSTWTANDLTVWAGGLAYAYNIRPSSPLAAFNILPASPHVYYFRSDHHVMELMWTGSTWVVGDLTNGAGAAPAAPSSPLAAFHDSVLHVYYLSFDNHVMELHWSGSFWVSTDLIAQTGAAPAASNSQLAVLGDHIGPHVYYQTPDNKVIELRWAGSWTWRNFTIGVPGAPLAAPGSPLVAFATLDEFPHVYYLSQDFHVVEVKGIGTGGLSGSEITT